MATDIYHDPVHRTPEEQERRRALSLAQSKAETQRDMTAAGITPGKHAYAQGSGARYLDREGRAIDPKNRWQVMMAQDDADIAR